MKVLIACEFSGIVRDAFLERGHKVISCDLLPSERPGPHYQGDVRNILNDGWDLMIAHPPCTYLTSAGNRWFTAKYQDRFPDRNEHRKKAIEFFLALATAPITKIAIENPVGIMSTIFRPPDQFIQPCHFGSPVRKRTALWLKGLLPLVRQRCIDPEIVYYSRNRSISKWHTDTWLKDPIERMKARSRTFPGVAKAMADQWG